MQIYDLLKCALARSNGSSFLLITQYEMPFINKSEGTKKVERPKNKTANVQMARTVGVVFGLSILFTSSNIISIFEDKKKRGGQKKGGENSPISPPLEQHLRTSRLN